MSEGWPGRESAGQEPTDAVTGAGSRALLNERLPLEIERSLAADAPCSVFLFDVDYFKSVNDAYGHARGDEILRQIADRVRYLVRDSDVLFRYGGDEFVLLLPNTPSEAAVETAARLVAEVKGTPFVGNPPLTVSISLGVATFPADATDAAGLLAAADRRNYLAKRRGRAQSVADDTQATGQATQSRLLERDAAVAAARDFFDRLAAGGSGAGNASGGPGGSGALRVSGPVGAGHTRFLAEVAAMGRLRGYEVARVPSEDAFTTGRADTDPATADTGLLILIDSGSGEDVDKIIAGLADRRPEGGALGVVYVTGGLSAQLAASGIPLLEQATLEPWSPGATRTWLRTRLSGEPSPALVDWLLRESQGLPARVERELARLAERGGLEQTTTTSWTIRPTVMFQPKRSRLRLPVALTDLIGRETEISQLAGLLGSRRLVTLVGPGGMGKTRLSLAVAGAVADRFDDGAVFVPLAEATTSELVLSAIAQALEVQETPGQSMAESVAEYLAERNVLIILDNFEQVLAAAPVVARLLAAGPAVTILVTSRERLRVSGEQVYLVQPLSLPDRAALTNLDATGVTDALARSAALALFMTRAQEASYDLGSTPDNVRTAAEICHRLDGLPLAIELAAARSDSLSLTDLLHQLSGRLDLLTDGPKDLPDRQQTLRATIDWSFALLDEADQALLTGLGVFAGGFTVEAVGVVCDATGLTPIALVGRLSSLVDKSLIRAEAAPGGGTRYRLLETIRAYVAERLAASKDSAGAHERHAAYFTALTERVGGDLRGPDQAELLARLRADYANLRAAFEWAFEADHVDMAARMVGSLANFWIGGSDIAEGVEWFDRVLTSAGHLANLERGKLLASGAFLAVLRDDVAQCTAWASEAIELGRRLGDRDILEDGLNSLGIVAMLEGDFARSWALHTEQLGLAEAHNDIRGIATASGNLTKVALSLEDYDEAHRLATRNLELESQVGNTRGIALTLGCLGEVALGRGDAAAARPLFEESMEVSRKLGDVLCEARAVYQLGRVAELEGDVVTAYRNIVTAIAMQHGVGDRSETAGAIEDLAGCLMLSAPDVAARFLGAVEAQREGWGIPRKVSGDKRWSRLIAGLNDVLDAGSLREAWDAGRHAPLDLIIAEALSIDPTSLAAKSPS
jgi:diguanylate cyclase (GGDEF)-like protein